MGCGLVEGLRGARFEALATTSAISAGGRLAWIAVNAMAAAAVELRDGGDLPSLADPAPIIEWLGT